MDSSFSSSTSRGNSSNNISTNIRELNSHQGTPNDVMRFPVESSTSAPSSTSSLHQHNLPKSPGGSIMKSRSIPIARQERSASERQLDYEEAMADYRDYVMYQRIAAAKQYYRVNATDGSTSALLPPPAIIGDTSGAYYYYAVQQQQQHNASSRVMQALMHNGLLQHPALSDATSRSEEEVYEEEGIFDLEL